MSNETQPLQVPLTIIRSKSGGLNLNLNELWKYRELLYFFAWRDIKVRYKQTVIGAGWAILQPFFSMVVFTIFFGKLARISSEGLPYPIFYYSALLPWMYFSGALNNATNTIVAHQRMITKVYFPRLILPLSAMITGLVDFAVAFILLIGMMFFYGMEFKLTALLLPLFLLLAMATALGVGLWLSALNAIYRDVRYTLPFLTQAWMFASPVVYPSSLVPEKWQWIYGLNPMAGVIEGFRWSLMGQGHLSTSLLLASAGIVILLIGGGILYFQKMEYVITDTV